MDIGKILGEKFKLTERDCGKFASFKIESFNIEIISYDANDGMATFTIIRGKKKNSKSNFRALVVTPKSKDLPILVYRKINFFMLKEFVIELYDNLIEEQCFPSLKDINDKYNNVPDIKNGVSFLSTGLLKESIYKKATKKSFSLSVDAFCEHLHEFGSLLLSAPECNKMKKSEKTNFIIDETLVKNPPFTGAFLKEFSFDDLTEITRKIIFNVA